jgi:hypothetical protein
MSMQFKSDIHDYIVEWPENWNLASYLTLGDSASRYICRFAKK